MLCNSCKREPFAPHVAPTAPQVCSDTTGDVLDPSHLQHKIKVRLLADSRVKLDAVLLLSCFTDKFDFEDTRADRGPFDEGAAQVKKLLTRDKRELMGVEQIGQRARTEFDEEDSKPSTSASENGSTGKENTRLFGEGFNTSSPAL